MCDLRRSTGEMRVAAHEGRLRELQRRTELAIELVVMGLSGGGGPAGERGMASEGEMRATGG